MAMEASTLLIRHLPSELTPAEKDDLLRHFGAVSVRVMGTTGPMKHTAFAGFTDYIQASKALARLHQLDILDCRLKVEFADHSLLPDRANKKQVWEKESEDIEKKDPPPLPTDDSVYQKLSLNYPRNPRLHYVYPSPTVSILTNIANALASYPRFYVQVLHLMNKMNLPAPFGNLTTTPPIPIDVPQQKETAAYYSSPESEIESDREGQALNQHVPDQIYARKRKRSHKRAKLVIQPPSEVENQGPPPGPVLAPSEVFEQVHEKAAQKKIQLKLPPAVASTKDSETIQKDIDNVISEYAAESMGGFGKIAPMQKDTNEETHQDDDDWIKSGVISIDELDKGRLPMGDLKELSVFRKYDRGEPSCRLYLKNLGKQVVENDLRFIYGCFIDISNAEDMTIFDVRVMKEGRMKGQAFVTLPSEQKALLALEKTNGYIIQGKPLVVQFARSAKQK